MNMKKTLGLSFVVLGFSSLVSQVVVARELAMSFYANEFFIGWILFCWLLGTALGSVLGARVSNDAKGTFRSLGILQVLTALLFPATLILIRSGRLILGTPAGALPELVPSVLYSLAVLMPLSLALGIQFAVAAKGRASETPAEEAAQAVGGAYLWECLGFIAGGVVFSFFLVFANEFRVAALVAFLNLAAAFLVFSSVRENKVIRWAVTMTAVLFPAWLFMASVSLQQQTSQSRFPNETLVLTENTLHGNVSVTRINGQYNFYQSGLFLGVDREDLASETLVHFPMLAHPAPQKVLLLGTGFNGPLQQILKHGPREVYSVELDPELLRITAGFLPEDLRKVLRDPRVRLWAGDPRGFLKYEGGKFDVIIANFPDPSSVLINRNYTEQFFRFVRSHLSADGVFATHITFAANTMTPELERLGSSVYATLGQVFPVVRALPEDTLFFLAAPRDTFSFDPQAMARRLSERGLRTDFVTPAQILYRFTNDRVERVTTAFQNAIWKTRNTDLRPRTCYFMFLRWLSQFDPGIAKKAAYLIRTPFPVFVAAGLFAILLGGAFSKSPEKRARKLALVSMGTAGFSLMSFEIAVIYLFQAAYGNLYYQLAWVITVFMVGLGIGTWAALRLKKIPERFALAALHLLNAGFFFLLMNACMPVFSRAFVHSEWYQLVFLGMALAGGLSAGMGFPFSNRLYLQRGGGTHLGNVYGADLLGSALGAILSAGFIIPVWGVPKTFLLLGALNAFLALLLFFRKNLRRKNS
jgi:spermidine synthase